MGRSIVMSIDGHRVRGALNDTTTAQAVAALLPFELSMCGTGIDLCGKMPCQLPSDPALVHRGWVNGDINYNPGGGWLAILFDDEENSCRYGDQLTIGRVTDPLRSLNGITGRHLVRFEDAEGDTVVGVAGGGALVPGGNVTPRSAAATSDDGRGTPATSGNACDAGLGPDGESPMRGGRSGGSL